MGSYVSRADREHGVAVWAWMGADVSPETWNRHLDDVRAVRDWPHPDRRASVLIHLVDSKFVPNARQRQQLAELTAHPRYRPNIALVTRNPVIRGVLQALEWVRPHHSYKLRAFKSLPHGVAWLEGERGGPLGLMEMLHEAHDELGVRGQFFADERPSSVEL